MKIEIKKETSLIDGVLYRLYIDGSHVKTSREQYELDQLIEQIQKQGSVSKVETIKSITI